MPFCVKITFATKYKLILGPLDQFKRVIPPPWKAEIMPNLMIWICNFWNKKKVKNYSIMQSNCLLFRAHFTHLSSEVGKMMCVTKMNSTTHTKQILYFSKFDSPHSPDEVPISRSKSEIPIYNIVTHMAKFWRQASTTVYQRDNCKLKFQISIFQMDSILLVYNKNERNM